MIEKLHLPPHLLGTALKEWAVTIEALLTGETILLLRKGGIQEEGGRFTVAQDRVLLYPTYEHQRSHLLKSGEVLQDFVTDQVMVSAWAEITDVLAVTEASALQRLLPYHIWTEQFALERLQWKPKQPLYVLLLRTYALRRPVTLGPRHHGCRSWIKVEPPIDVRDTRPVLSQREYGVRSQRIIAALPRAGSV